MKILDKYAELVTRHPLIVITLCILASIVFIYGAMQTTTSAMNYADMLPKNLEEIKASNLISDEFTSSGTQLLFVIEIDPNELSSNESRDIRDERIANYIDLLSQKIDSTRGVAGSISYTTILKSLNSGKIPQSTQIIKETITNAPESTGFYNYISDDYSVAILRVYLAEMSTEEENELLEDLDNIALETEKPAGVKCSYTGDLKVSKEVQNSIGPTMSSTSTISLLAILIIVCILFMSIRRGLISLLAIAFGTLWVFGSLGIIRLEISSIMSGAVSMIMGIGIDFGIQVVNRFAQEIKQKEIEEAMKTTLNNTLPQMVATTVAALIGFRAMSLGQLTILSDLSTMMSLGILFCFLAAATIIPPILILNEKLTLKTKSKQSKKIIKK